MSRRVKLPGASELFRATHDGEAEVAASPIDDSTDTVAQRVATPTAAEEVPGASGRVRHDEKITVYVSTDELMALEEGRLILRRSGLAADRGRIVRESIALAIEDLRVNGEDSALARRLGTR
ncbi:MAG TPA: hypothetical protein VLR88_04560 [Propionibacteriaceae bacterium]|nr:hypothetical protein [Propionibacteriaceae bacterium]